MPGVKVDVYLIGKETEKDGKELLEIFSDINSYFKKSDNIESKLLEIDNGSFTSLDIVAFKCLPESTKDTNPG